MSLPVKKTTTGDRDGDFCITIFMVNLKNEEENPLKINASSQFFGETSR